VWGVILTITSGRTWNRSNRGTLKLRQYLMKQLVAGWEKFSRITLWSPAPHLPATKKEVQLIRDPLHLILIVFYHLKSSTNPSSDKAKASQQSRWLSRVTKWLLQESVVHDFVIFHTMANWFSCTFLYQSVYRFTLLCRWSSPPSKIKLFLTQVMRTCPSLCLHRLHKIIGYKNFSHSMMKIPYGFTWCLSGAHTRYS